MTKTNNKVLDFNCYGESLDSTPDFFAIKKYYEEQQELEELNALNLLEEQKPFTIFVNPKQILNIKENNINILEDYE